MKILYLDCSMGAAGDMLSGALLDLLPDKESALAELNSLGVPGVAFKSETVTKCGIAATHLSVAVDGREEGVACRADGHGHDHCHGHGHAHSHHHQHRSLAEVLSLVENFALEPSVKNDVRRIYESLAAAESRAHGCGVGEVHFHEVGAMDAMADIAAFCHLLRKIAPDRIVASPVHVGSGTVECAHGALPVPAPAAAFLLEGVPSYSDGVVDGELCTPTGAALLRRFADSFGPMPPMKPVATGHGAGLKDFTRRANMVRATLGESFDGTDGDGEIFELEFNVDDMTGEELAFASARMFEAGAKDVSFAPVTMKKGRPGHRASVMCDAAARAETVKAIFAHTSTLGIRQTRCRRYTLERRVETVALPGGGAARRKIASGYGTMRAKWEADDLAAFARSQGLGLADAAKKLSAIADGLDDKKGEP